MSLSKVWLITGCSTGFGNALAIAALAAGHKVIATARSAAKLESLKAAGAATLELDVTAGDAKVQKVIDGALQIYGVINILVNNAGFVLTGSVEECSDEELKAQFETNVFGLLTVTRAVLPHLRSRKTGVIANIGSLSGWRGYPGTGAYSGTKFAVAGLTDALRQEIAHLGIEATVVDLGAFRTNLVGNQFVAAKTIADLEAPMDAAKKYISALDGNQRVGW